MTTVHEYKDYRLRPTVTQLRDFFGTGDIYVLQRIAAPKNISNALPSEIHLLNTICIAGYIQ